MNKILLIAGFILHFTLAGAQDTFSIVAVDTLTGELGSAGASCIGAPQIPQGCYILSDVIPGVGAIHTQAYYTSGNQNYAHTLMIAGVSPSDMIDSLVANDVGNNPTKRQYGIVDFYTGTARTAAYTGVNCDDYKNHIIGTHYAIQGNILLGQQILDSMEARFLAAEGPLACKLMAALQGAKVIGADTRCLDDGVSSLSSFLRVAQPNDPINNLYLDLNVPSTPVGVDPIDSLQSLVDLWGGCVTSATSQESISEAIKVFPNPASRTIRIEIPGPPSVEVVAELRTIDGLLVASITANGSTNMVLSEQPKPGIYICTIRLPNHDPVIRKLIIQ